ncbi:MAG: 2-C-methyl-D-erythritol 2,4-cyclodiphosphate synthase [Caldicoprobacterales bacterium]|jgi:2-C-methyl-D-erythritol 2,4-cyclodiphosphate synthase|nr:2-C-methyl-D-erythritol 2,4-cyclodiphosphate synthase [Clostridiales bacterium]
MRIGIGFDVHKLTENRPLIIGGVEIPWEKGLLGHSDADVLLHAIMDALLGAAGMGDIGRCFPDNDESYRNISSLILLEKVNQMLKYENWNIVNIDAIIIAEKPKMMPFIPMMQAHISNCLGIDKTCVNIKATTTEKLGFTGRGEGIAAQAAVLIRRPE